VPPHTRQNANAINQRCALYRQAAASFNAQIAQDANSAALAKVMDDHPDSQERIAAIAAETDWLHVARSLPSMQTYPRARTVIVAVLPTKNPIFAGIVKASGQVDSVPSVTPSENTPEPVVTKVSQTTAPQDSVSKAKSDETRAGVARRERTQSPFITQWNALDDALDAGVITKAEYDRKLSVLLAKS
jgi:hypothetical protein